MRYGSIFSGGELAGVGALQAGYTHAWGIEKEAPIAEVANLNGFKVMTADVLLIDPNDMDAVDLLHASPPCPNFSAGNNRRGETETDISLANKVAEFIRVLRPPAFVLENVYLYRKSESYKIIRQTLDDLGYFSNAQNYLASNYGVPQSRRRLVLRAVRGRMLREVERKKSGGWYEAIKDLIPSFKSDELAPWQLARMESDIKPVLERYGMSLIDSNNARIDDSLTIRHKCEASVTVTASRSSAMPVLIAQGGYNQDVVIVSENDPSMTITANSNQTGLRMSDGYQVLRVSVRGIARFQTVPDWYVLPELQSLAIKIIGNGVPCELARRVYESMK